MISIAVRWYLRYGLSYGDVEELLAERGVAVDYVTVYRWVQRFTSKFVAAARVGNVGRCRPFGDRETTRDRLVGWCVQIVHHAGTVGAPKLSVIRGPPRHDEDGARAPGGG